ncbi:hypothetical protein ACS5PK_07815 [Roseateles sp. DB2]|uniref:hypothetical protein n=1 Tax=Roseateles sp. DB2 TaxID=3453717 RepID=UPI003EEE3F7B
MLDLTGRQRCLWGQVLLRLEAQGLLQASLPGGLDRLPAGSPPQAWIEQAQARGQALAWLLRQLALLPQDLTLHALGRDLGLCVDSRERLQSSPGWRHWTGLESAAQGLSRWPSALQGLDLPERSRSQALEGWARRLLCLRRSIQAGKDVQSPALSLVLDLGGGQLLVLDESLAPAKPEPASAPCWQLGALPRHVLDNPPRSEACFEAVPPDEAPGLQPPGHVRTSPGPKPPHQALVRLRSGRPAAPRLSHAQRGRPQPGPVLLLGADPGKPPQLCLALLQGRGWVWHHDASPEAMGGGGLCLDAQCRLLGYFPPLHMGHGRSLALLWN